MKVTGIRVTVGRMMLAVAVFAILLAGYLLSLRSGYRHIEVVNRSGQAIPRLTVMVSGERREVENLIDDSSATVTFWGGEGARFSVSGYLKDRTPVSTSFQLMGDPKRFGRIMGTIEPTGKFRLALSR